MDDKYDNNSRWWHVPSTQRSGHMSHPSYPSSGVMIDEQYHLMLSNAMWMKWMTPSYFIWYRCRDEMNTDGMTGINQITMNTSPDTSPTHGHPIRWASLVRYLDICHVNDVEAHHEHIFSCALNRLINLTFISFLRLHFQILSSTLSVDGPNYRRFIRQVHHIHSEWNLMRGHAWVAEPCDERHQLSLSTTRHELYQTFITQSPQMSWQEHHAMVWNEHQPSLWHRPNTPSCDMSSVSFMHATYTCHDDISRLICVHNTLIVWTHLMHQCMSSCWYWLNAYLYHWLS